MERIIYKENGTSRAIIIIVFGLLLIGGFLVYQFGILHITNFVNDDPYRAAFLGAIIFFVPIFFLIKNYARTTEITFSSHQLLIRSSKESKDILFENIQKIHVNVRQLNSMDLIGKNDEVLFEITPFSPQNTIENLEKIFLRKMKFSAEKKVKSFLKTNYISTIYTKI